MPISLANNNCSHDVIVAVPHYCTQPGTTRADPVYTSCLFLTVFSRDAVDLQHLRLCSVQLTAMVLSESGNFSTAQVEALFMAPCLHSSGTGNRE